MKRLWSTLLYQAISNLSGIADDIMNFWVVKTDYVSYAVIYGCIDREETYGNCSEARAEVLSRKPSLPDLVQTTVNSSLKSVCVNLADLKTIPQNNMCHFPDNLSPRNMAITAEGGMLLVASFVLILTLFTSIRSL